MAAVEDVLEEIDQVLAQSVSLIVARMEDGAVEGNRLLMNQGAAESFRDLCVVARDRVDSLETTKYATTAELGEGQFFLIDDEATLSELAAFTQLATSLGDLPTIAPADLDLAVRLYAVALGDKDRVLFVRRADPRLNYRRGRILAIGEERLERVEGPSFSFSPDFDFIVSSAWAIVLNQKSFEMLFREIGLVQQHIDTWIGGITAHLPMADDDMSSLREVALSDSRTWRKLREIEKRGHLASVELNDVQKYASRVGLDPDEVVVDGALKFDASQRFSFLHLLNEDLYRGPLTEEVFEAQRKAPAT
jgi:hypothetical protein